MAEYIDTFKGKQLSVLRIINCRGVRGGDAFLVRGKGVNLLFDSGYGFSSKRSIEKIKSELENEKLDYIFLTHSHYDHAMGSAYLKRAFPETKIIGGEYCAHILQKPTAKLAMRKMDIAAAKAYGFEPEEDLSDLLGVDIIVKDSQVLHFGEHEIEAVSLPGHTKCCMGYYFKKEKMLVSCETLGIYVGEMSVLPGCLVGYRMTLDSIEKAKAMDIEEILIPHSGMLYKDKVYEYLAAAEKSTTECMKLIADAYKSGADEKEMVKAFKDRYYSEHVSRYYPEPALMANLKAQIPMFINECCK